MKPLNLYIRVWGDEGKEVTATLRNIIRQREIQFSAKTLREVLLLCEGQINGRLKAPTKGHERT